MGDKYVDSYSLVACNLQDLFSKLFIWVGIKIIQTNWYKVKIIVAFISDVEP